MIGGLKWREGVALGCAMNARGSTEVIVASIGLSMGALSQNLYTMIVTMAMITTMAMPPMLRAALSGSADGRGRKKAGGAREAGRKRLCSQSGAAAAGGRMQARSAAWRRGSAGLMAGGHGMPVTILKLNDAPICARRTSRAESEKSNKNAEAAGRHRQARHLDRPGQGHRAKRHERRAIHQPERRGAGSRSLSPRK